MNRESPSASGSVIFAQPQTHSRFDMRHSRRQMATPTRHWRTGRASATAILVAATAAAATAQWLVAVLDRGALLPGNVLEAFLALSVSSVNEGHLWQFFTFIFLHASPVHLLGNLLLLYFAGRDVEPILGTRHLLGLYFGGNLLGGIAHVIVASQGWVPAEVPLVGISAGVMAVLVAFSTILPDLDVRVSLFFVLPVSLRAKFVGITATLVAVVLWIAQVAPSTGPAAMLAGGVLGWVYVKQLGFGCPLRVQRFFRDRKQRAERLDRMPPEQFINEEIDPILEKISREGMHSLTRTERRILEQGREKIAAKTETS
jgi:membrane associated rhomboid family serine protease